MSRDDFEKWFEENYRILLATAGRRVGYSYAEDAVAGAMLRALSTRNYERCETKPLTWFMQSVKSVAANMRRSEQRVRQAAIGLQKIENPSRGKRTPPRHVEYSDDWADDRESVSPPTSARRVSTRARDWS
jgi:DNA-directed RNA polymerase specialized sigma24 family protein